MIFSSNIRYTMNRIKSGIKCAIENCGLSRRQNVRLFKLLAHHKKYNDWVLNCRLKDSTNKNIVICEKHFEKKYFTKRGLSKYAVPTLNLFENKKNDSDSDISMVTILSVEDLSEIEDNSIATDVIISTDNLRQFQATSENMSQTSLVESQNNICSTNVDMTLEDITCLPEPASAMHIESDIEPPPCNTCLQNIKNENYYRLNYNKLLKTVQSKDREIRELKKKCNNYSRKFKRTKVSIKKSKPNINDDINKLPIDENAKNFCKMLTISRFKNQKWPEEQKIIAQNIFYRSSSSYKYLRESLNFNLPSKSSLIRWQPVKYLSPGFNNNALMKIKEKLSVMSSDSKQAVLLFDEIHIRSDLIYNIYSDQIDGFVDYGKDREAEIGKLICCFMIRGLSANWKFVLSYYVSQNSISADRLFLLIQENLSKCFELGVKIKSMVCDQGPNNRKCLNMFGITIERPYFLYNDAEMACIYDVPHLIKSVRNTLMKSDIKTPDGLVSWNIILELYNLEVNSITKCCPKITAKHIYPNNFEKMRVKLATQIFSRSVVAGIKTAIQLNKISSCNKEIACSTYKFIEKIDKLFDCLNSKTKYEKNPFRCAFITNNEVDTYLEFMVNYISNTALVNKTTVYCFKGLIQSIRAIQTVSKNILWENIGIEYILTSRYNQDPVENLFAQIRAANGNNRNPSVHEFNHNIAKITTVKILSPFSNISNCENDTDEVLETMGNLRDESNEEVNTNSIEIDHVDDISDISENFFNLDVPLQEASMRYFVGYVACKILRKIKCSRCENIFIKTDEILEAPSEYLISNKNYGDENNFCKLKAPTDYYFKISKEQIYLFSRMFSERAEMKDLKKNIVQLCIANTSITCKDLYVEQNPCHEHNKTALNFMILVLIRKHCTWLAEKHIQKNYKNVRNPNWRILLQGK